MLFLHKLFIAIVLQADYSITEQIRGSKELTYSLAVKKPFEVATQFSTTFFEPLTKGFVNEPFIIMPHITCVSPWPINILSTTIELVSLHFYFSQLTENKYYLEHFYMLQRIFVRHQADSIERENNSDNQSILTGITLCDGETGTDAYCLIPKTGGEQPISTGVYTIRWKR